jgi:uncharacterized protein
MRGRIFSAVCCLMLACGPAIAQAPVAPDTASPDTPSKEQVLRFLDLMEIKARMVQMMDGMKGGMKTGAEEALKQQLPNPTPEQLAQVDALADTIFKDLPINEMIAAMIPIYQRHLTKTELDSVVAFYSSPAGQKLLKEQPAMMAEGMKAGQAIMMKRIPELTQRLNDQVAKVANEAPKKSPASTDK